ncbi:PH-like domain-containing protein [Microbacterium sp. A84]|uniref:PH-like domain-containing protein n=1 Tax=Microbacterium sp. A84 TaxID=3450715 RepID=UPI003F438578
MRDIAIAITIGVALLILLTMFLSWRRRLRRDAVYSAPLGVPEHAEVLTRHEVLYVSTTRHGEPLERLAITPLAYRARGELAITDRGAALCLDGSPTVFLASAKIVAVDRATVTIDRVVEPGGLVRLAWKVDDATIVDSYLRASTGDPNNLISELQRLIPADNSGATS